MHPQANAKDGSDFMLLLHIYIYINIYIKYIFCVYIKIKIYFHRKINKYSLGQK